MLCLINRVTISSICLSVRRTIFLIMKNEISTVKPERMNLRAPTQFELFGIGAEKVNGIHLFLLYVRIVGTYECFGRMQSFCSAKINAETGYLLFLAKFRYVRT